MIRKLMLFWVMGLVAQVLPASNWDDDCKCLMIELSVDDFPTKVKFSKDLFQRMTIRDDVFKSVTVGEKCIKAPRTFGELLDYLTEINQFFSDSAEHKKSNEVTFQYGDTSPVVLKIPAIGEGKHTRVYEIKQPVQGEGGQVFKLTKCNVASLRATLTDIKYSPFWFNKQNQREEFYVPPYIECHQGGLFRVAEKCDGISLTSMLIYMGVLSFDDKCDFGESASSSVVLDTENFPGYTWQKKWQKNLTLIKQGVMKIFETVRQNPTRCPSLSPNNIYITFTKDESGYVDKVQQIVLVDIGASSEPLNRIKEYEPIKTFDDYLKIAKESLKSYLKSENYKYDFGSMCDWLRKGRQCFLPDLSTG